MTTENTTAAPKAENLEGVMRRIQKLLAIAGDDRANPEEASAAASMAAKIMRKYQLEHADVVLESLRKGDDMHKESVVHGPRAKANQAFEKVPTWVQWIAVEVGKCNDCGVKITRSATGDACVQFYGFKQDVMVAKFTFEYLCATVLRLCNEYKRSGAGHMGTMDSYRKGVSSGIYGKLRESRASTERDNKTSTTGTALVVAKARAVAEYGGEFKTKASRSTTSNSSAFGAGVRDGRAVDVNRRAVTNNSSSVKMIGR